MFHFKLFLSITLALLIAGCGGGTGFQPAITGVKQDTLQYGKSAIIYLGGKDLRSNMVVDTNGACIDPSFASNSTTDMLVLNCTVKVIGNFTLTIKNEAGVVLNTTPLTVDKPQVRILTSLGNFVLELDPAAAPITVNNFLSYVNNGFYQNTLFHRVISGFMIQGGGYTAGLVKKDGLKDPIVLESNNGLTNLRGTVAMARTDVANSATSEFFINHADNGFLNYSTTNPGYAVFGKVIQGMDVVDIIASKPTAVSNVLKDVPVPVEDITITSALQIK
jgi:peptidyl-prolyl cis-trans isomerase A (cyclophilin A)